jgi:hypothetical protein
MIEFIVIIIGALAYFTIRIPIVRFLMRVAGVTYLGHLLNQHHAPWGMYLVFCYIPFGVINYVYRDKDPS